MTHNGRFGPSLQGPPACALFDLPNRRAFVGGSGCQRHSQRHRFSPYSIANGAAEGFGSYRSDKLIAASTSNRGTMYRQALPPRRLAVGFV